MAIEEILKANDGKWGYLRESQIIADRNDKKRPDPYGKRFGLEIYLAAIFGEDNGWKYHDRIPVEYKGADGKTHSYIEPDYKRGKQVIEFDGLPHYRSLEKILDDIIKDKIYQENGFEVIRIPYFIQLTNDVVREIFNVEVGRTLFDANMQSLDYTLKNTPGQLPLYGVWRMAAEYLKYPEQYRVNVDYLEKLNKPKSGLDVLRRCHDYLEGNPSKTYVDMIYGMVSDAFNRKGTVSDC